ncbi:Pol polyprotein [Elysia marginata]|uniref:Pol polyprotein n=1 Tax=Elysia marginata TaxID=1093978 RepID=A0AAV4JTE2_9GAST|nr:Pol polyprotein [Elysia marginata]
MPRVTFLRHIISANGIQPEPKNVHPILDAPTHRTVKQTRSFFGMTNYYSRFVNNLATIAELLPKLTRKKVRFIWNADCQSAFDKIKHAIADSVHAFIFYPNAPTFIMIDASDVGFGSCPGPDTARPCGSYWSHLAYPPD